MIASACACAGAAVLFAQGGLDKLRASIHDSKEKLKRLDTESARSATAIEDYRRQTRGLDTLLDGLEAREEQLAREMIDVRGARDSLSDELAVLRAKYATMTRALFKRRLLTTSASVLLLPQEHEELALRQRLFERYGRMQRQRAVQISSIALALSEHDSLLRRRQQEQLAVIGHKRAEMERLFDLQRTEAASLGRTMSERNVLKEEIDRQNAEAAEISRMIVRLDEQNDKKLTEERERRARADEARRSIARPSEQNPSDRNASDRNASDRSSSGHGSSTADRPHPPAEAPKQPRRSGPVSFIWPTSGRRIVEGYGERTNPETGTVTLNPGINIAAPSGSLVVASEDGVVSLVSWLPSYGTIVIVEHRDGYRTVYGNLAGALVSRGTSVDAGERIGTVGGGSLHFEIWRGQTRLNPTTVLR